MIRQLHRHRGLAALLVVATTFSILPGCKPAKVDSSSKPPSSANAREHSGRLDWSSWQRWVQTRPRIVLVSEIDGRTRDLIERQSQLFLAVIGGGGSSSTLPDTEIARMQDAFFASSSRTGNSPVPTVERWDRYSNAVRRIQPGAIATAITTLEAHVRRDRQDLTPRMTDSGDSGRQARSDLSWIDSAVMPIIERLKEHTAKPALSVDQARQQWQTFETDSLPKLASAIKGATTAETTVAEDGTYRLSGNGEPVAVITVAGRDLYFPASPATPGLRFLR